MPASDDVFIPIYCGISSKYVQLISEMILITFQFFLRILLHSKPMIKAVNRVSDLCYLPAQNKSCNWCDHLVLTLFLLIGVKDVCVLGTSDKTSVIPYSLIGEYLPVFLRNMLSSSFRRMTAVCFSETMVPYYQSTRCQNPAYSDCRGNAFLVHVGTRVLISL